MLLKEAVAKRIKEILKEKNLTQYALFRLTGVPQSTLSTIASGEIKTVKLSTIYDICSGLEIEFTEFFNRDYFKLVSLDD